VNVKKSTLSELSKRAIKLRKSKGFSQEKFAEVLGVKRSSIASYESGNVENPPVEVIVKILTEFKDIRDWFLTGEEAQPDATKEQPAQTGSLQLSKPEEKLIETIRMLPPERQEAVIKETQKDAERDKQLIEMQERLERLEKEKNVA
jgi:transcriptional regulator with XRE-family HTH domain